MRSYQVPTIHSKRTDAFSHAMFRHTSPIQRCNHRSSRRCRSSFLQEFRVRYDSQDLLWLLALAFHVSRCASSCESSFDILSIPSSVLQGISYDALPTAFDDVAHLTMSRI
jgi:hypothetical protein